MGPVTSVATAHALRIGPADHPAFDGAVEAFVDRVAARPRSFGPSSIATPKPLPSLLARLRRRGDGIRIAAFLDGAVVGLVHVDIDGDVAVAVDPAHRASGIGTGLVTEAISWAERAGHEELMIQTSRRARAALALGRRCGFEVRECRHGRIELVRTLRPT